MIIPAVPEPRPPIVMIIPLLLWFSCRSLVPSNYSPDMVGKAKRADGGRIHSAKGKVNLYLPGSTYLLFTVRGLPILSDWRHHSSLSTNN